MLLFVFIFFSSIWRETTRSTRRFDDFFSDGYLPEFTKRQDPVFFCAKTGLLLAKIKHHNWPPIFLLEEQGIVLRNGPMLLPQPKIWYKEKKSLELWKLSTFMETRLNLFSQIIIMLIMAVYEKRLHENYFCWLRKGRRGLLSCM